MVPLYVGTITSDCEDYYAIPGIGHSSVTCLMWPGLNWRPPAPGVVVIHFHGLGGSVWNRGGALNRSSQYFILNAKMECLMIGQRYLRGFTATEKTELWDRWQRGELLKAIGRAFGKPSSSIYFQVAPHGGIRPAPRRRSRSALTFLEREEISRGIAAHQSARSVARLLGHSPSTVSREISRNGGYHRYRAAVADERARARAVVRSVVSWRTIRGYERQWHESSG